MGKCESYVSEVGSLSHRQSYPQSYKDKFLATTNFAQIDFDTRLNEITLDGIRDPASLKKQSFHMLNQSDGTHILGTEEFKVQDTITVQYRQAADGGDGAIDLTETELEVGDTITFNNLNGEKRTIVAINAKNFVIDGRGVTNFGSTDIEGDQFFYEKRTGEPSRRAQSFEIVFKPPLGVWKKDVWLPSHDMSLKMYPHPAGTYEKNVIESVGADKIHGTDFLFNVEDMIMYLAVKDIKHADGEYDCVYDDMRCQLTNLTTTSNVDNHFIVDRDSHSFTVCFADENTQNDTRRSATRFKIRNEQELLVNRYWISYNGDVNPTPYPQISKTTTEDFLTQRFYESVMYSDVNRFQDVEDIYDWEGAGIYFTHQFGKSHHQTEKVTVSTLFTDGAFGSSANNDLHRPNLLLFDHYTRTFKMVVSGGKVREIYADRVN